MASEATHLAFQTLIEAAALAPHLRDPDWLLVDCRFDLADAAAGKRAWRAGHIPGARHAGLDRDLSGPVTPASGRHPLPAIDDFAMLMKRWGVGASTQLVAYDAGSGAFAARLWWLLRWLGHESVAVLNGGLAAWVEGGGELSKSAPARRPAGDFVPRPQPGLVRDAGDVTAALARGELLVDARARERFDGEVEPLDTVAGHVPGAVNHPFQLNLDDSGRFLDVATLRARWQALFGKLDATQVTAMCGSGITACHHLLAMEAAGLGGARLYAGSWSEWIREPSRPVARGR